MTFNGDAQITRAERISQSASGSGYTWPDVLVYEVPAGAFALIYLDSAQASSPGGTETSLVSAGPYTLASDNLGTTVNFSRAPGEDAVVYRLDAGDQVRLTQSGNPSGDGFANTSGSVQFFLEEYNKPS